MGVYFSSISHKRTVQAGNKSRALHKHKARSNVARENVANKFCKKNNANAYISVTNTCVIIFYY